MQIGHPSVSIEKSFVIDREGREIMHFVVSVCISVCPSVCLRSQGWTVWPKSHCKFKVFVCVSVIRGTYADNHVSAVDRHFNLKYQLNINSPCIHKASSGSENFDKCWIDPIIIVGWEFTTFWKDCCHLRHLSLRVCSKRPPPPLFRFRGFLPPTSPHLWGWRNDWWPAWPNFSSL